jgi:hypothetical protein
VEGLSAKNSVFSCVTWEVLMKTLDQRHKSYLELVKKANSEVSPGPTEREILEVRPRKF